MKLTLSCCYRTFNLFSILRQKLVIFDKDFRQELNVGVRSCAQSTSTSTQILEMLSTSSIVPLNIC